MSSARYVGRVGALAVALGIGAVIAGVPGVAWAGPEGDSPDETKTSQSPSEGSGDTGDSKSGDTAGDLGGAPDDGGDDGGSGDNDGSNGAGPGDRRRGRNEGRQLRRSDHVDSAGQCGREVEQEGPR